MKIFWLRYHDMHFRSQTWPLRAAIVLACLSILSFKPWYYLYWITSNTHASFMSFRTYPGLPQANISLLITLLVTIYHSLPLSNLNLLGQTSIYEGIFYHDFLPLERVYFCDCPIWPCRGFWFILIWIIEMFAVIILTNYILLLIGMYSPLSSDIDIPWCL